MANPSVYLSDQERERALIRLFTKERILPLKDKMLLEIGCGTGGNLLEFNRLGFNPGNLTGNELLPERAEAARKRLPQETRILAGDAMSIAIPENSFDIVCQFTVFSSILDKQFQSQLSMKMWSLIRPGGGILWYDFVYDNPANRDVRGMPMRRIRELFPHGNVSSWRITLAPPISRLVTRVHPSLYAVCNMIPLLRTHVLCWIQKPLP